ncbi:MULTISPECIES: hypothetical protein [Pseudomonas fluorescens group]|jgi:hypothetical protein|uniref:hypothetical protein n=1 Tax=Pseudomonas fluorescens group TaxID=136843 RepID=UPI00098EDC58|nr:MULTISPECIES: hypothetical protein [Pseudomonas fluorescens group]AQT92643.1 hypothetical protein B1R45_05010 [Pseudomonas azotoformans]UMY50406.1 hypothetical protein MLC69_04985 [Pseudomonas azotoformans]WLG56722.1 hypothetical protein PSH77_29420 [Pseudomonas extremorientalis]
MGHSAEYLTELYINQLEQMAQTLFDQGVGFKDGGHDELAKSAFEQPAQLKRVIVDLRKIMGK